MFGDNKEWRKEFLREEDMRTKWLEMSS